MLTIVIAHGVSAATRGLSQRIPTPLFPLVDKPFLQHIVEFVVDQGGSEFDVVLSHLPEKIENLLGDGTRWGCKIRYHLAQDPWHPYDIFKSGNVQRCAGPILLLHADRFPTLDSLLQSSESRDDDVIMFCSPATQKTNEGPDDVSKWTGWAIVSGKFLEELPSGVDEKALEGLLHSKAADRGRVVEVPMVLDIRTYDGLLAANRVVLNKGFEKIVPSGKEVEPGIWISRSVSLHPSAHLVPPVFLGANSRIAKGTGVGPFTVIGPNCILDSSSTVSDSIVVSDSHVGEAVDLKNVIADKNYLINVRLRAEVSITDNFILASLAKKHAKRKLEGLFSRTIGVVLLLMVWPIMLLTMLLLKIFRKGPVFHRAEVIRIPAADDEIFWQPFRLFSFLPHRAVPIPGFPRRIRREGMKHLFLRLFPSLINVAAGRMRFVGLPPRTRDEILSLGEDWKALYLDAKQGMITEAFVRYGPEPTEEELYSAEAVYSVMGGPWYDFKLVGQYLKRLLLG